MNKADYKSNHVLISTCFLAFNSPVSLEKASGSSLPSKDSKCSMHTCTLQQMHA